MKRTILTSIVTLILCARTFAQATQPAADVRVFEINPVAPPTPALKYELHYDLATDRLAGNSAQLYQDSILILGPELKAKAQKAMEAYEAKDMDTFRSIADSLDNKGMQQEMDIAARRQSCNWEVPLPEMGPQTLLPHLEPIVHGLTPWIKARALRQMDQSQIEDALKTLRLGYEMAEKVGEEPTMVSGLVSLRITSEMNDALAAIMSRPDSPNLYFALCEFPSRQSVYRTALYRERRSMIRASSSLARATTGETLSAQEWRTMLKSFAAANEQPNLDPIKDATPATLAAAVQLYMQHHRVSAEQAKTTEPAVVLGEYYVEQAEIMSDDLFKWRGMPYPIALEKTQAIVARMQQMKQDQPSNPFLPMFDMTKTIGNFAKVDRQVAALTAVESIRSYAAAHNGKLPEHLEDIKETPAPVDPATGNVFHYRVDGDSAVLSADELNVGLAYTVKVRG